MAFFDSPKNRTMWERELKSLRERKELRAQGLDDSVNGAQQEQAMGQEMDNPNRIRITYVELLRQEAEAVRAAKAEKERVHKMAKERAAEKSTDTPTRTKLSKDAGLGDTRGRQ